jgi:hypothetical protein
MSKNRFSPNGDGRNSQPLSDDRERWVVTELSSCYKELTGLWEETEEKLRKFHIPVDVPVCYKSEDEFDSERPDLPTGAGLHSYLGFVRWGGTWRICYCRNHDNHPDFDFQWKPIVDCRLDIRQEAFNHIDKLREAIVQAAEECVPRLQHTIAAFRDKLKNW